MRINAIIGDGEPALIKIENNLMPSRHGQKDGQDQQLRPLFAEIRQGPKNTTADISKTCTWSRSEL